VFFGYGQQIHFVRPFHFQDFSGHMPLFQLFHTVSVHGAHIEKEKKQFKFQKILLSSSILHVFNDVLNHDMGNI